MNDPTFFDQPAPRTGAAVNVDNWTRVTRLSDEGVALLGDPEPRWPRHCAMARCHDFASVRVAGEHYCLACAAAMPIKPMTTEESHDD